MRQVALRSTDKKEQGRDIGAKPALDIDGQSQVDQQPLVNDLEFIQGSSIGSTQKALKGLPVQVGQGGAQDRRFIVEQALGRLKEAQQLLPGSLPAT